MVAYDAHIGRYHLRQVLDMSGLSAIFLTPEHAVLRFETAAGCDPCGADFIETEVQRMTGVPPLAVITLPTDAPVPPPSGLPLVGAGGVVRSGYRSRVRKA